MAVHRHLDGDPSALRRIQDVLGLSMAELGHLFGFSREDAHAWMDHGVPVGHQEKVAAVAAITGLLNAKLSADHISDVVRRPADAYGGQMMLDLIAADRHRELAELTRGSFDWADAA